MEVNTMRIPSGSFQSASAMSFNIQQMMMEETYFVERPLRMFGYLNRGSNNVSYFQKDFHLVSMYVEKVNF